MYNSFPSLTTNAVNWQKHEANLKRLCRTLPCVHTHRSNTRSAQVDDHVSLSFEELAPAVELGGILRTSFILLYVYGTQMKRNRFHIESELLTLFLRMLYDNVPTLPRKTIDIPYTVRNMKIWWKSALKFRPHLPTIALALAPNHEKELVLNVFGQ